MSNVEALINLLRGIAMLVVLAFVVGVLLWFFNELQSTETLSSSLSLML